jgi:hypothetical protein
MNKIQEIEMPTQYEQDVRKIIDLLDNVATRGYMSEPVKSEYSDRMMQRAVFTEEEKKAVRSFQGKYAKVLRQVDYPLDSFFGEKESRTASLLSMISYMIGGDEGSDPDYVSENSGRLEKALVSHKGQFESLELSQLEKM